MSDLALLAAAGTGTALATGLGAVPVFTFGGRTSAMRPLLWGIAAGVMTIASLVGLLEPALDEGSATTVAGGLLAGVLFLLGGRRLLATHDIHIGVLGGAGVRRSVLVFGVLFVHSLPEGLAIGTAFASKQAGLGLFVLVAIALQNVPEGTATAIPMQDAGFTGVQQFWAAVGSSAPQPIGAVAAYVLVEEVAGLLPVSFAFAAGAMLALVAFELVPLAFTARTWRTALIGSVGGAAVVLALSAAVGV